MGELVMWLHKNLTEHAQDTEGPTEHVQCAKLLHFLFKQYK